MRNAWWWVLLSAWSLVAAGCRTFPPLDVKTLPTAKDHPDAKYVVLLDEKSTRYVPEGPNGAPQAITTARWRVKVLKPTVLPPMRAYYSRTFNRVESMRGRVVKPDGTEEPIDDSKKIDHPIFDNSVLVTDERVIQVPVPPLPVGAVFESEIVTRDLEMRHFIVQERFGDVVPVKEQRLIVSAPKEWTVRWLVQAFGGEGFAPKEEEVGTEKRYTFERTNLPALELDPRGPPAYVLLPLVAVRLEEWVEGGKKQQALATPEVLSAWLGERYEERATVTPELEQTVKEVLSGVPDEPEAKARALYEHACRSIQYCAIEVGYGGWIPDSAASVQKGRYGDCKGKANYLHTLLKIAGIPSAPTVIYAHQGTPKPFVMPALGPNFNHAILAVDLPGRTVYADPTWRVVPFGQLPPSDQEAPVLELRPGGGAPLKTTPASEAASNVERQLVTLTLDGHGDGDGTVTLEATGASALSVKSRLLTGTGKLSEWLNEKVWNRSAHVGSAKPTVTGDFVDTVAVEGTLEVRQLVAIGTQGDALFRLSDVFSPWTTAWPHGRKTNVVYRFAETMESTLVVRLPAGAEVRAVPADVELESADGLYRLRWKKIDAGLEVTRSFTRKNRVIPAARLPEANRFASQVLRAEHAAAVLRLPREASR